MMLAALLAATATGAQMLRLRSEFNSIVFVFV